MTGDIFDALADSRRGRGNVYAQQSDGKWTRVYQARMRGFVLHVCALGSGRWFIPAQWEVR